MQTSPSNRRPGAQPGNKNALKAGGKAESFLMCRVRQEEKRLWTAAARLEGLTLSQWVIRELNKESAWVIPRE